MRRPMRTTPRITPAHHRAHIRAEVLLHHTLETPLHGRAGSDLHLGQKPKLGGGIPTSHTHLYIILCWYFVYPCFVFFLSFFSFLLCCCFSKHKKTKNISVVSLYSFL